MARRTWSDGFARLCLAGCAKAHKEDVKDKKETVWVDGQPAYYALLPFTVVADIATSPIQIPLMIAVWINGGPHF